MKLFFKRRGRKTKSRSSRPPPWACRATAIALLPVLSAVVLGAGGIVRHAAGDPVPFWPALTGAAAYGAFQWLFQKPMTLYVFGHELSHALAAWLSGYRVKSFSASSRGGEVVLTGTNVWIALAPYCVPIYTLAVMLAFSIAKHAAGVTPPPFVWSFAIGATFAFHLALTVYALYQRQPDLRYAGTFLSMVLILLANAVVFVLVMKALFPIGISLRFFVAQTTGHLIVFLDLVLRGGVRAVEWAASVL
jgi:hypothetical protein